MKSSKVIKFFLVCTIFLINKTDSRSFFGCYDLVFNEDQINNTNSFSYNDTSKWPGVCSSGQSQSPIVYNLLSAEMTTSPKGLSMQGAFDKKPTEVHVINNGHGAAFSFKFNDSSVPQVTGGPFGNDVYNFIQFHSHWPCEHRPFLMGSECSFETHFVHFNSKYGTIEEAIDKPNGLAVIGILYYIAPQTPLLPRVFNSPPYMDIIHNVLAPNSSYSETENAFSYADAIGFKQFPRFVSYSGSLTTPECLESVTWIVVDTMFPISKDDIDRAKLIRDSKDKFVTFNNRPTQNINGRTVRIFFDGV